MIEGLSFNIIVFCNENSFKKKIIKELDAVFDIADMIGREEIIDRKEPIDESLEEMNKNIINDLRINMIKLNIDNRNINRNIITNKITKGDKIVKIK